MLGVYVSQVQFSRSWSQDFGTRDCKSQAQGFQFQGPSSRGPSSRGPVKVSGPRVSGLRVPGSRVSGSWVSGSRVPDLRVPGLRVQGLGSQVLILDYAEKNMQKENNSDVSDFSENQIPDVNSLKPVEFEPKTNIGDISSSSSDDEEEGAEYKV